MKWIEKIQNKWQDYKFSQLKVPPKWKMPIAGKKVFETFLKTEEHRFDLSIIHALPCDWEKVESLANVKYLKILIPTVVCAKKAVIRTQLPKKLKSIIGMKSYKNLWFDNYMGKSFLKQKWYSDNKLPIVVCFEHEDILIDGNHRLAQMIHHGDIKYLYVTGDISWNSCLKNLQRFI